MREGGRETRCDVPASTLSTVKFAEQLMPSDIQAD